MAGSDTRSRMTGTGSWLVIGMAMFFLLYLVGCGGGSTGTSASSGGNATRTGSLVLNVPGRETRQAARTIPSTTSFFVIHVLSAGGSLDLVPAVQAGYASSASTVTIASVPAGMVDVRVEAFSSSNVLVALGIARSIQVTADATSSPVVVSLTPTASPTSNPYGSGSDQSLTVSSSFNLNTQSNGNQGRTAPDGVAYPLVQTAAQGQATLDLGSTITGIAVGDEVLIIKVKTDTSLGGSTTEVGQHETGFVASVGSSTMVLASPLAHTYTVNSSQGDCVIVQRIPHYSQVSVTGTLTASAWNGSTGGILFFRCSGTLDIAASAVISMTGTGFREAQVGGAYAEQYDGLFADLTGASNGSWRVGGNGNVSGGASGHAGSGTSAGINCGGGAGWYGGGAGGLKPAAQPSDATATRLYLGGGAQHGGGGGGDSTSGQLNGTQGSPYGAPASYPAGEGSRQGGGIIAIAASTISMAPTALIESRGGKGGKGGDGAGNSGGGGGGSGASGGVISLTYHALTGNTSVNVRAWGGDGGDGGGHWWPGTPSNIGGGSGAFYNPATGALTAAGNGGGYVPSFSQGGGGGGGPVGNPGVVVLTPL